MVSGSILLLCVANLVVALRLGALSLRARGRPR
jgi:hypothetical protein